MSESKTPRTDNQPPLHLTPMNEWVTAKFARQLETELNQAKNEIARLNGQTNYACECGGTKLEAIERDQWREMAKELAETLKGCTARLRIALAEQAGETCDIPSAPSRLENIKAVSATLAKFDSMKGAK